MRPISVRLTAAGVTPWIPLNRLARDFKVALAVLLSPTATLTYTVQHTLDLMQDFENNTATRSGTTATFIVPSHGLSVADFVKAMGYGAPFDGEFAVASVSDDDTFSVTVANSGLLVGGPGRLQIARVLPHSSLAAQSSSGDGNYNYPPIATRLNITAYTDGFADFKVSQGMA